MSHQFFGQFLLEGRIITREQLEEGLRVQRQGQQRLGEALVHAGHLNRGRLEPLLTAFHSRRGQGQWGVSPGLDIGMASRLPEFLESNHGLTAILTRGEWPAEIGLTHQAAVSFWLGRPVTIGLAADDALTTSLGEELPSVAAELASAEGADAWVSRRRLPRRGAAWHVITEAGRGLLVVSCG
ncbi:MAG: hypothetical protein ACI9WU_004845 [Myxococcota bacterium]